MSNRDNRGQGAFSALKALQSVGGLRADTIILTLFLVVLVGLFTDSSVWLLTTIGQAAAVRLNPDPLSPTVLADATKWYSLYIISALLVFYICFLVWSARKRLGEIQPRVHVTTGYPAHVLTMFVSNGNLGLVKDFLEKEDVGILNDRSLSGGIKNLAIAKQNHLIGEMLKLVTTHVRLLDYDENGKRCISKGNQNWSPPDLNSRKSAYELINIKKNNATSLTIKDIQGTNVSVSPEQLSTFFNAMPWRMNVEGLRAHIFPRWNLHTVVLVPSPQSKIWLDPVSTMLRGFLTQSKHSKTKVVSPCCFGRDICDANLGMKEAYDYFDLSSLVDLLYKITRYAKITYGFSEDKIIVDITSGSVICSAAGLSFATLVDRRKVQYVNTGTYKIENYDVTHDVDLK